MDPGIFSEFQIGFSNGTLLDAIPEEDEVLEALKEIGILNDNAQELFYGCALFLVFEKRTWRALGGRLVGKVKSLKALRTRRLRGQRRLTWRLLGKSI
jgi:hypothetical protein